ncbi:MAG: hypothetical protein OD918_09700, partial [Gammaproteobacteria bacterium]
LRGRRPPRHARRAMQNIQLARRRLSELALEQKNDDDTARAETELALLDDLDGLGDFDGADDGAGLAHSQNIGGARMQNVADARAQSAADAHSQNTGGMRAQNAADARAPKTPGKFSTALLLTLIPLLSALLYLALGNPAALTPHRLAPPEALPPVGQLLTQLEHKLEAEPGNAAGWRLAAQTYMRLGRFADAARAYRVLHQLRGDDAGILAAWADAEIMANDGAFTATTRARIQRALALRPDHQTALWLAALAAESQAQPGRALGYLQRLQPLLAGDSQTGTDIAEFIGRMRREAQSMDAEKATGE